MARSNPWVDVHDAWYRRATPAERAAFDASRECPKQEVFTPAKFPSLTAWALFLTHQCALDERVAGTPLPMRHVVKGQVRVFEARQDREKAIGGIGRCSVTGCRHESLDVQLYRSVAADKSQGAQDSDAYLCPACARWRRIDPLFNCASVEPLPLEG